MIDCPYDLLVLIGFKHVGKSSIARRLAERLSWRPIDLDEQLLLGYPNGDEAITHCRALMHHIGEVAFRQREERVLMSMLKEKQAVLALGGGTPLTALSALQTHRHCVIHIKAEKDVVLQRILASGVPAFFEHEQAVRLRFDDVWHERQRRYQRAADRCIVNDMSIEDAVDAIYRMPVAA